MGKKIATAQAARRQIFELADRLLDICLSPCPKDDDDLLNEFKEIQTLLEVLDNHEREIQLDFICERGLKLKEFTEWLAKQNIKLDGIEITYEEGECWGIRATKEIKEQTQLVAIPRKHCLTSEVELVKSRTLQHMLRNDPVLGSLPNVSLALILLNERANPASQWRPYLDTLPNSFSTPLYFTTEQVLSLRGSSLFADCLKLRRNIARQYAYFQKGFHQSMRSADLFIQSCFTYDDYRWAVSCVMTRQNPLPKKTPSDTSREASRDRNGQQWLDPRDSVLALVPVLDMFNHDWGKMSVDYESENDQAVVLANGLYGPGAEVTICYASRSNVDMLLHNGFAVLDNPYDRIELYFPTAISGSRIELLREAGITMSDRVPLYRQKVSTQRDLIGVLHVAVLAKDDIPLVAPREVSDLASISADKQRAMWTLLASTLARMLKRYPTSLAQDENSLIHASSTAGMMISRYLIAEKSLLEGTLYQIRGLLTGEEVTPTVRPPVITPMAVPFIGPKNIRQDEKPKRIIQPIELEDWMESDPKTTKKGSRPVSRGELDPSMVFSSKKSSNSKKASKQTVTPGKVEPLLHKLAALKLPLDTSSKKNRRKVST